MFGIEFGTVVFLTCAACGHGLGATQRRTRRDTTTRTGGGSMSEDLSLRERPCRATRSITRWRSDARERPRRHVMAHGIPHSRRTRSRVVRLLYHKRFVCGFCRPCSARRARGQTAGPRRSAACPVASTPVRTARQLALPAQGAARADRTARPPNKSEQGWIPACKTVI